MHLRCTSVCLKATFTVYTFCKLLIIPTFRHDCKETSYWKKKGRSKSGRNFKISKYITMELKPVTVKIMKGMSRDCEENTNKGNDSAEESWCDNRDTPNRLQESRRKTRSSGAQGPGPLPGGCWLRGR